MSSHAFLKISSLLSRTYAIILRLSSSMMSTGVGNISVLRYSHKKKLHGAKSGKRGRWESGPILIKLAAIRAIKFQGAKRDD